jgi:dTDP-4-dehydrorhamnose reductase
MLGQAVVARAAPAMQVVAIHRPGTSSAGLALDLLHPDAAESIVNTRPDWIIHCAANTDVDWCESHPVDARLINTDAPRRLAVAAARLRVRILYVSTDAVFDGRRGMYREDDRPSPLSTYAQTKLDGETEVLTASPMNLVLRTNMFGWRGRGRPTLVEWIVDKLSRAEAIEGFTDVRFSPLYVATLADVMLQCMASELRGIYHAGSIDAMTKFDFARTLASAVGSDPDLVIPALSSAHKFTAPRPRNTTLNSAKVMADAAVLLPTIDADLRRLGTDMAQAKAYGNTT